MGREILFRGKRIDNDNEEWVYGSFVTGVFSHKGQNRCVIMRKDRLTRYMYEDIDVDPKTVCQYTGLTDKYGKKIFEGDIVKVLEIFVVQWKEKLASWCLSKKGWMYCHFFGEAVASEDCEVIGNIFDNPDLLTTSSTDSD